MVANQNWMRLRWTEWVSFVGGDFKALPTAAGIYRIKIRDQNQLAYIGQTGRNLRERLSDLRRNTLAKEMPFNDPHTAAPSLWAWHHAEGYEYECSAFTSDLDAQHRQAGAHRSRDRRSAQAYVPTAASALRLPNPRDGQ